MDLTQFTGTGAFGFAYRIMLENDAHAPGSVDRQMMAAMVRLCPQTADYLYSSFTPLKLSYRPGNRRELEAVLDSICRAEGDAEEVLRRIVEFTCGLSANAEQELSRMVIGGTEEEIIRRGSDWCTDVARAACVLSQIAGFPARIVNLFDLDQAYSGHVIIETFREGKWGALDSSTGVVYVARDGKPASVWQLMNDPELIEAHRQDSGAFYTSPGQFRAGGLANYLVWEADKYDYTTSGLNQYYFSILEMSNKGWPGGLRWLHGENNRNSEAAQAAGFPKLGDSDSRRRG